MNDRNNTTNKKQDWRSNDSADIKSPSQARDTSSSLSDKRVSPKPTDTISSNANSRSTDSSNKRDTSTSRR